MHLYTVSHEVRYRELRLYLPDTDTAGNGIESKSEAIPSISIQQKKKRYRANEHFLSLYVLY